MAKCNNLPNLFDKGEMFHNNNILKMYLFGKSPNKNHILNLMFLKE